MSVAYRYSAVGVTSLPLLGSSCRVKVPVYGDLNLDQALYIRLVNAVDHPQGEVSTLIRLYRAPHHQGCALGDGRRPAGTLRLRGNGDVLSVSCQPERWKHCVGHETPTVTVAIFIQVPLKLTACDRKYILDRLQSPKREHPETDLFIPLIVWFNLDPAFVLFNCNVTFDKFFVEVEFASVEDCVSIVDLAASSRSPQSSPVTSSPNMCT